METLDYRAALVRRLRFLPRKYFAIAFHCIYQGELTTLRKPRSFNQLVSAQNMKPADSLVSLTSDKFLARDFIAGEVGPKYLVPVFQVVEDADELDLDNLPVPCAIKATHGYDMNMFIRDAADLDPDRIRATVRKWLETDFYPVWKERPYIGLKPRCIVEQYLGNGSVAPDDFKFHMFGGKLGLLQVHKDRFGNHKMFSYDDKLNRLNIKGIYPTPAENPPLPSTYDEMLAIAEKLSAGFELVRIDLYSVDDRIYVGEITHNPGGGLQRWSPKSFDYALGDLWLDGKPIPSKYFLFPPVEEHEIPEQKAG